MYVAMYVAINVAVYVATNVAMYIAINITSLESMLVVHA